MWLLLTAAALASCLSPVSSQTGYQTQAAGQQDTFSRDRPGQPTIDMRHYKDVYAKCYNPQSSTHLTSPQFEQYLSDLGTTFTEGNPLLLHAQCVVDHMNNNVAACGFYFDPTDYYRQAVTNMDGRPKLFFTSCSLQLDGGNTATSNTCWTDADSTSQATVVRSAGPETNLGPTAFSINVLDNNPAVGGTYVGQISIGFTCSYYLPPQLLRPG